MWHLFMHVTPIYTLTPTSWVVQWSWFAWVNALCNLSCKKSQEVAASFQGQFLSSHCFMLCITVEVEPRIAKQYKCQYCCSWKLTGERGWRVEQKCLCIIFLAEGHKFMEKMYFGAWATSYCLLPDTFWLQASINAFKVGSVTFANSLSLPSIVKKVCTGSKSSQGT